MKRTINVNVGSFGFTVDDDAYELLKKYLGDIRSRLNPSEADEIMGDIETRIADIFRENSSFSSQVITIVTVRRAMNLIGQADDFGEQKNKKAIEQEPKLDVNRLYRSRDERVIAGVCGGVAAFLKLDVTLVRVLTFILLIFGGVSLWVYIVLWVIVPQQPLRLDYFNQKE